MQKGKDDSPVGTVKVLSKMKNSAEASRLIGMAVDAVKGVLRNRGWKVGTVTEFYPKTTNLLGLNVNRGQVIKIRLRSANNPDVFLEYHDILGTMVHEVTHIKISPHDATFYKLMDELYDEVEGVTSFPFPGGAKVLGGGKPAKPSKLLIREAALSRQKNSTLYAGSGQKLGSTGGVSTALTPAQLRAKALEAAEKRLRDAWSQNNVDVEEEELKTMRDCESGSDDAIDIREVLDISSKHPSHAGELSVRGGAMCAECLPSSSIPARKRKLNCLCCQGIGENGELDLKIEREKKVRDVHNRTSRASAGAQHVVDLTNADDSPGPTPKGAPVKRGVIDIVDISDS